MKGRNDPSLSRSGRAGLSNVRRPLRGMEIKQDTYASLKVLRADGSEVAFSDSSSSTGSSTAYSNFILQSVQEARMEKHQIVETFGETYIYFFGESPRFLDVQAVLLNSNDFNWEAEWWDNWNNVLRGSKSVENGSRTYLFYDDNVVEGYMLMSNAVKMSTEPFMISMTFRMFVSNYRNVSFIGDPNFPVQDSVQLPPDVSLTSADAFSQLVKLDTSSTDAAGQTNAWNNQVNQNSTGTFGSTGRLIDAINNGTRSVAFPASVQAYVDSLRAAGAPVSSDSDIVNRLTSNPIRSLISDNSDEYTASGSTSAVGGGVYTPVYGTPINDPNAQLPEALDPTIRDQLEVEDLFYSAISWMACYGANINGYNVLSGMGMGVSFGNTGGVGIGLGTGVGAGIGGGATFGPTAQAGVGFGGTSGRGFGFGSPSGIGFTSGSNPNSFGSAGSVSALNANRFGSQSLAAQQYASALQNPGGGDILFSSGASTLPNNSGLDTGYGDPTYGYPSPYGGPGFGQSGYGDYGGLGFGSSLGATGDPGYLAPGKFSFAGLPNEQSAVERIRTPGVGYGSGFGGTGVGNSFSGVGAGSSVSVGGAISAFSMSAVPGTLDASGTTLSNPFGVPCMNNGGGASVSLLALI